MHRILLTALLAGPLTSVTASPSHAVGVTLHVYQPGSFPYDAYPIFTSLAETDAGAAFDRPVYNPTSIPDAGSLAATLGAITATTGYDLSNAGFEITLDHSRTGDFRATAGSFSAIRFSVDADVDFVVSGSYTAVDADGGELFLGVTVLEEETAASLFRSEQRSDSTPNESFVLGAEEGDAFNHLEGSPVGTLLAGRVYVLDISAFTHAYPTTDAGATASGVVNLVFVPEPGTAPLLLTGMLGLASWRKPRGGRSSTRLRARPGAQAEHTERALDVNVTPQGPEAKAIPNSETPSCLLSAASRR